MTQHRIGNDKRIFLSEIDIDEIFDQSIAKVKGDFRQKFHQIGHSILGLTQCHCARLTASWRQY